MDSPSQKGADRAEMRVLAKAASCGVPWRPGHVQYRNSMLRWSLHQTAVCARARQSATIQSDGSGHFENLALSSVDLETSVRCGCQLSGTPVVSCTFRAAHCMTDGNFHECVSERQSAGDGTMTVCAIPPDGESELVRYSTAAPAGAGAMAQAELSALARTRLPLEVCTYASERENGRLFFLHARLRLGQGFQQLRNVRCVLPLHPRCQPGSVRVQANVGRAQVHGEDTMIAGGSTCQVLWELANVGNQTGYTQEHERIECEYEAVLDVQCAISGPFILFPYHLITREQDRPGCVPAESLAADCNLWSIWNNIVGNLHKLDEMKRPFPRDRTSSKMQ